MTDACWTCSDVLNSKKSILTSESSASLSSNRILVDEDEPEVGKFSLSLTPVVSPGSTPAHAGCFEKIAVLLLVSILCKMFCVLMASIGYGVTDSVEEGEPIKINSLEEARIVLHRFFSFSVLRYFF